MCKTGEYHSTKVITPRMAEMQQEVDYTMERLRHDINAKLDDVIRAYEGKEVVISVETIGLPPHLSSYLYQNDFEHKIEYQMKLTALLLNWKDAEVEDCVHMHSIDGGFYGDGNSACMPDGSRFIWEGKWWKRTE